MAGPPDSWQAFPPVDVVRFWTHRGFLSRPSQALRPRSEGHGERGLTPPVAPNGLLARKASTQVLPDCSAIPGRARIVRSRPLGRPGRNGPPAPKLVSGRIRLMQAGFAARVGEFRGR